MLDAYPPLQGVNIPRRFTAIVPQAEIERAIRAAKKQGLTVARVEVEGAKIVVHTDAGTKPEPANPLDAWKAKRDARSA